MPGSKHWIIDKSALVRLDQAHDVSVWINRIERGLVYITSVTRLEIGFSARSGKDLQLMRTRPPVSLMPIEYLTPAMETRAGEVQELLAHRGQHRAPGVPDLLIAAAAELTGATILHVDKDFELVAALTSQPHERLRLKGGLTS